MHPHTTSTRTPRRYKKTWLYSWWYTPAYIHYLITFHVSLFPDPIAIMGSNFFSYSNPSKMILTCYKLVMNRIWIFTCVCTGTRVIYVHKSDMVFYLRIYTWFINCVQLHTHTHKYSNIYQWQLSLINNVTSHLYSNITQAQISITIVIITREYILEMRNSTYLDEVMEIRATTIWLVLIIMHNVVGYITF